MAKRIPPEQLVAAAPPADPVSFVWWIGVLLVIVAVFGVLVATAVKSAGDNERCQKRVDQIENTVDGQESLRQAREHPPIGYDLNDSCSRKDYLESKIR